MTVKYIEEGHTYGSGIPDYKGQRDNMQILGKTGEGVGISEENARGLFDVVNVGHQTESGGWKVFALCTDT